MTDLDSFCPPGFDCTFQNSCPSYNLPCPEGYFCSSYEGYAHENLLDFEYAQYKELNDKGATVTEDNKEQYIDPTRSIQTKCLLSFFCSDAYSISPCPSGHWCSEGTIEPMVCDGGSLCNYNAAYQLNFICFVIAVILSAFLISVSYWLNITQKRRLKNGNEIHQENSGTVVNELTRFLIENTEEKSYEIAGKIEIYFSNILVQYKNRTILPNISGHIPPARISAILGPTSCGKSTLLNMIKSSRYESGLKSGLVDINILENNHTRKLQNFELSKYVGYVPQEDILDRELTIRELFTFNALTRLDETTSRGKINSIVNQVLKDLVIEHVADQIIGGGENAAANISGGQLKRVNIGCELVALTRPAVLLLDEPTAGLDAAIAFELIETLEKVVMDGVTIFMVIQQPRAEIFERFEKLFLMNANGYIVYEGQSAEVVSYLNSLNYHKLGDETSDADFCIDILNGLIQSDNTSIDENQLASHWQIHSEKMMPSKRTNDMAAYSTLHKNMSAIPDISPFVPITNQNFNQTIYDQVLELFNNSLKTSWKKFFFLCYLNAERLWIIRLRNVVQLLVYFCINAIMAGALSTGFSIFIQGSYLNVLIPTAEKNLQPFYPSSLVNYAKDNVKDIGFTQMLFFMSSALSCGSALAAVPVFAGQLPLMQREFAAGLSPFSYAIGRITADLTFVFVNAFIFAGVWTMFGHAGAYYNWILVVIGTAYASSALGYICSAFTRKTNASVYTIIIGFVCCVFSGTEPSLRSVNQYPIVNWPWYLSFATWCSQATYYTWSKYLLDDGKLSTPIQEGADYFGYDISDDGFSTAIEMLFCLGTVLRIIAIFLLWYKCRN